MDGGILLEKKSVIQILCFYVTRGSTVRWISKVVSSHFESNKNTSFSSNLYWQLLAELTEREFTSVFTYYYQHKFEKIKVLDSNAL